MLRPLTATEYYCYAVEATLVLFWAFSLTASVYGWSAKSTQRRTFSRVNLLGKTVSVVLPIVVVGLLQVQIIQDYRTTFIVIADFQCRHMLPRAIYVLLTDRSHHQLCWRRHIIDDDLDQIHPLAQAVSDMDRGIWRLNRGHRHGQQTQPRHIRGNKTV